MQQSIPRTPIRCNKTKYDGRQHAPTTQNDPSERTDAPAFWPTTATKPVHHLPPSSPDRCTHNAAAVPYSQVAAETDEYGDDGPTIHAPNDATGNPTNARSHHAAGHATTHAKLPGQPQLQPAT